MISQLLTFCCFTFSFPKDIANGVRHYFNELCSTQLLYALERQQYNELVASKQTDQQSMDGESSNIRLSTIYGFPHLLRLFVRMGHVLAHTDLDEKSIHSTVHGISDLLKYFAKNCHTLFQMDSHETATSEHQHSPVIN